MSNRRCIKTICLKALKAGTIVFFSELIFAGKGLESVQGAIELYQKGGISAQKIGATVQAPPP